MNDILVIIPAFNEEANIEKVADRLIKEYPQLDYIIVNDGSKDRTAEICRERGYRFLDLPVNLGLAGAFRAGMRFALKKGYRYAVQFDGDGQHRPEYIEPMRAKMDEGYDIVIASRFVDKKKPHSMRMLGSNLISAAILMVSGKKLMDPTSGMRMYDAEMIRLFAEEINYPPEPDTVCQMIRSGARVAEIQAEMDLREAGVSYLTPINAMKYMTRVLISILFIQTFRIGRRTGKGAV